MIINIHNIIIYNTFYNLFIAQYMYCIYLYTDTVLSGSVCLSVRLFVRYRNHLPVVQFQN